MATDRQAKILAEREDAQLKNKRPTFRLVNDCYAGGSTFKDGDHLYQYIRESTRSYTKRKERSIYINYVQPLTDMLVGFLYENEVQRKVPSELNFLFSSDQVGRGFENIMQKVAMHSLLYTCGILVDSPKFNAEEIRNEQIRKDKNLNPFLVIYYPWQIRDYSYSSDGSLDWVLLDDSNVDKSDPYVANKKNKVYRLWTKTYFQDVIFNIDAKGKSDIVLGEEVNHPCKEVPFVFQNWKDVEEDYVAESVMEDIAFLSKSIYNQLSYVDETLASGAFKSLFFPVKNVKDDIPPGIQDSGFGNLSVIPYKGDMPGKPFFDGPDVKSIDVYLNMLTFLAKEIFKKLGLDKDEDKGSVQSGEAKRREFKKAVALLKIGATSMEQTEEKLLHLVGAWLGKYNLSITIQYSSDYDEYDVKEKMERLKSALEIPVFDIQKAVYKQILRQTLKEDLTESELLVYLKMIDKMQEPEESDEEDRQKILDIMREEKARGNNITGAVQPGQEEIIPDENGK